MSNREFVQLAHVFEPAKHSIAGWFYSEKLDGMRAWWDGGITRGLPAAQVPWANVEKHGRFVNQVISTGLWSRYGQVIRAPDWWLDFLPKAPFDGELYAGREMFQFVMSTVKDHVGSDDWNKIRFTAFGMPSYTQVLEPGKINNKNFKKTIMRDCLEFAQQRTKDVYSPLSYKMFQDTYATMKAKYDLNNHAFTIHHQVQLPFSTDAALFEVERVLTNITDLKGEGLILQKPEAVWNATRMHSCLKVKKWEDSEGTVIGCSTGRETDKGSKLLGLMGALILELDNGKKFDLSGFTDEERALETATSMGKPMAYDEQVIDWAKSNPGARCPNWIQPKYFKLGTRVTFRFRELSDDGIPKEARYWRKKED